MSAVVALALAAAMLVLASPPAVAGTVHGTVDFVTSEQPGTLRIAGWAFDDAAPTTPLMVHVYVGGPAGGSGTGYVVGLANQYRPDVPGAYPGSGVGDHQGIDRTFSIAQHGPQRIYVYFIGSTQTPELDRGFVTIADVPPETTITTRPPASGTGTAVTFEFGANEASTFQCRLDQTAWVACASPASMTVAVGAHTFAVMATNSAGTPDPSPATYAFTVDEPPPPPPPVVEPPPPPPRISVHLKALRKKGKPRLRIDVRPGLNPSNYQVRILRKAGRKWRVVTRTQTLGPRDRITVKLRRGQYRVVVPNQHGMAGSSATIRLRR